MQLDDISTAVPSPDPTSGGTIAETLRAQTRLTWPRESELLASHGLPRGTRVADICCGIGDFAARLYDAFPGLEIEAIDWSDAGIALARQLQGKRRINYTVADATSLPHADNSFDVVICRHALQVMPRSVRTAVVAELARICRPGGVVYVTNEQLSLCGGYPGGAEIAAGYQLATSLFANHDIHLDCGLDQAAWLVEAGLREVRTLPWLVTSEADSAGFVALIDHWTRVFGSLAEEFQLAAAELEQILAGLAAHRRAAALGCASWPIWSSFGRKPGTGRSPNHDLGKRARARQTAR